MYSVTTFCYGNKYSPIRTKWVERIQNKCLQAEIKIYENVNQYLKNGFDYAWWDIVRMTNNLELSLETQKPVVQVDMDIIIEKDIQPLVDLNYDFIVSTEIGGNKAYPSECSKQLGFGICTGFYVIKPTAHAFLSKILSFMNDKKYNNYSDQVTIMNYIVEKSNKMTLEEITFDGITYSNKIIEIDGIRICVLDFELITRDPILTKGQFANHINVDNVGGTMNFLRYFDEPLENLPLTCRCGKTHLGDHTICPHIDLRNK